MVRGCAVPRRYIHICNSYVNIYLDHLKLCGVCINGRRYVCSSEWYVVSNECDEPTPCLMRTVVKLCTLGVFCFRGELDVDEICMCVVNKQLYLLEFVFISVYVDLKYNEISLTFTVGSISLCSHVIVLCL